MPTRAAELLYDSEATLRLVDNVLDELHQMEAETDRPDEQMRLLFTQMRGATADAGDLPALLLKAYGEIQEILAGLRQSRDVLERTGERGGPEAPADIIRQQLSYASSALLDTETRLARLVRDFEPDAPRG